jgi:threonylcarbamoyladenosine tRNA methylthiotransferase MtaB
MLRLMRRPYTIEQVSEFCAEARRRFGERLAFGADIITGFPGETDSDFNETKSFLASSLSSPIPHLHIFPYSEREGTEAAAMKPSVPLEVRRARAKELEAIAVANHEKFARSFVGREVEVCVERDGNGRTDEYVRCVLKGTAPRRSIVRVTADDYFPKTGSLSATIRA